MAAIVLVLAPNWLTESSGRLTAAESLKARNDARGTLVQAVAAIGLAGGLFFTYATYRLSQSQQITERFSKAVEQLGHESRDVRIGGIYSLNRILRDSPKDQPAIAEVLAAYIRGHAAKDGDGRGQDADVSAALKVLATRPVPCEGEESLFLAGVNLVATTIRGGHFEHANFTTTNLRAVQAERAHFENAWLLFVDLSGAFLSDAHLRGAVLQQASLRRASVRGADFRGADLRNADLRDAFELDAATLTDADLAGAQVTVDALTPLQLAVIRNAADIQYVPSERDGPPPDGPSVQI